MISGDELRSLFRRLPSSVAVLTVDAGGERVGLTISSFVSLSLEPPLVGVSVARQAAMHELLREAETFALNLLGAGQESLAQHFARGVPPIAMWHDVATVDGTLGAPLLADSIGWIECRVRDEHEVGDHTLFVGEAVSVAAGPPQPPLVHYQSAYRAL